MYFLFSVMGDSLVFAGSASGQSSAGNPLDMPLIKTQKGPHWNASTNTYTIREASGVYLIGLSVATPVRYGLVLSGQQHAAITRSAITRLDTTGMSFIVSMYAADTLHVFSSGAVQGSANNLETSVAIFSLSNVLVSSPVMFSVARQVSLTGSAHPFPFDTLLYNDDLHYNTLSHAFTAPSDGVYFFSFSIGMNARRRSHFVLYLNEEPFVNISRTSTTHRGIETVGRSVMMELEEDDIVYMVNELEETARSSVLKETSFSGFKYEPKSRTPVSITLYYFFCILAKV